MRSPRKAAGSVLVAAIIGCTWGRSIRGANVPELALPDLVVLSASAGSAPAPAAGQKRSLAILPGVGTRAPSPALMALLEVGLSQVQNAVLVERAEIDKILREQKIALAGFGDPATAVRAGQLLSADLFAIVEKIPKSKPVACRVKVIEARTGIVLASVLSAESHLTDSVVPVVFALHAAVAKAAVPEEKRRYVAILGFRNEEPGRYLDGLANGLGMLLANDLARSPRVMFLDREHLDRLKTEEALTGLELQQKASAIVLEGGVRRDAGGQALVITVNLRSLAGRAQQPVTDTVPRDGLAKARGAIAAGVLGGIDAGVPAKGGADPQKEAALFVERARLLLSWADYEAAMRAVEAAYALSPTQQNRLLAARVWKDSAWALGNMSSQFGWGTGRQVRTGSVTQEDMPTARKLRAVRAQIREKTLTLEAYRHHAAEVGRGAPGSVQLPRLMGISGPLNLVVRPEETELSQLREELAAAEDELFRFQIDYYAQHYARAQGYYWQTWVHAVGGLRKRYAGQAARQADLIRRLAGAFADPPGQTSPGFRSAGCHALASWPQQLQGLRPGKGVDAERVVFVALCRELVDHREPLVRIAGYAGLIAMGEDGPASSRSLLEVFVRELPPEHPYRSTNGEKMIASYLVSRAIRLLAYEEPEALGPYCRQIVGVWIDRRDSKRLQVWRESLKAWLQALVRAKRYDEADGIARRAMAALASTKMSTMTMRLHQELERERARYAEKLGTDTTGAPAEYEVRPVDLQLTSSPDRVLLDGDQLYCVRAAGGGRGKFVVTATAHRLPKGGKPALLARSSLTVDRPNLDAVTGAALGKDALYVGTGAGLLVIPRRPGSVTVVGEAQGLPSNEILSVVQLRGKVYLGFGPFLKGRPGKAGFAVYDPNDGSCRLLASNSAATVRTPLDGGQTYWIHALLADEKRNCVWLGISVYNKTATRSGLWRYVPKTDQFEHFWPERLHCPENLAWSANGFLSEGNSSGLFLVDPDNAASRTFLACQHAKWRADWCKQEPAFGRSGVRPWPAAYDGQRLLTGAGTLHLHRRGQPPKLLATGRLAHSHLSRVAVLAETGSGVLAIGTTGKAVLLVAK